MVQHKIVVGGNHELSLDERTMDECREYMEQVGEMEHMNKEQLRLSLKALIKIKSTTEQTNTLTVKLSREADCCERMFLM